MFLSSQILEFAYAPLLSLRLAKKEHSIKLQSLYFQKNGQPIISIQGVPSNSKQKLSLLNIKAEVNRKLFEKCSVYF